MAICDALLDYYLPNQVQRERAHRDLMARDGIKDSRLGMFKTPSQNGGMVAATVAATAAAATVAGPGLGRSAAGVGAGDGAGAGAGGSGGAKGQVGVGGGGDDGMSSDERGEQGGEARDVDDEVTNRVTIGDF